MSACICSEYIKLSPISRYQEILGESYGNHKNKPKFIGQVCPFLTCYNGRNPPAHNVIEPHVPKIDVSHFSQHAVDMKLLNKHPSKCAHVEVVQKNGYYRAHKLEKERIQIN